jgi:predicted nucleic acid-binding protein
MTDTEPYLVDSSGWIEFLGSGPKEAEFASYIEGREPLLLPTVVMFEVYKKLRQSRGSDLAELFASFAYRQSVIRLDEELALSASVISLDHRLSMADAIIYASARARRAQLLTTDLQFQGLPFVTLL